MYQHPQASVRILYAKWCTKNINIQSLQALLCALWKLRVDIQYSFSAPRGRNLPPHLLFSHTPNPETQQRSCSDVPPNANLYWMDGPWRVFTAELLGFTGTNWSGLPKCTWVPLCKKVRDVMETFLNVRLGALQKDHQEHCLFRFS